MKYFTIGVDHGVDVVEHVERVERVMDDCVRSLSVVAAKKRYWRAVGAR